jgi:predicted kinase
MIEKQFAMLIGPSGSGKSTYRKKFLSDLPCISPDDFIRGKWTPKKCSLAWEFSQALALQLFSEGTSFCVDAQFLDPEVRRFWVSLAKGFGYRTHGVVFDTPLRQLFKNQKARGDRGGYGLIPREVVLQGHRSFRKQFAPKGKPWHEVILHGGFDTYCLVRWGDALSVQAGGVGGTRTRRGVGVHKGRATK